MKKDNKIMKFTSFVLLITVIALILVAGTYAKYTSTATGSDTAVVAKWDIKAGVKDSEVSITGSNPVVAFNLFDTILDEETNLAEADVTSGKIAPGTKGEFELSIKNDSEVTAQYAIDFTVTKGARVENANILFSTNGDDWTSDLADITASDATKLGMTEETKSATVKVMWKWAYETGENEEEIKAGDATDTTVGTNANAATIAETEATTEEAKEEATKSKTIEVQAILTATQVD